MTFAFLNPNGQTVSICTIYCDKSLALMTVQKDIMAWKYALYFKVSKLNIHVIFIFTQNKEEIPQHSANWKRTKSAKENFKKL